MSDRIRVGHLDIEASLHRFIAEEALPADLSAADFWSAVSATVDLFAPRIRALLLERDRLQHLIDEHHRAAPGPSAPAEVEDFLREIGYLHPSPGPFQITTTSIDPEIGTTAGPQLVVPLLNPRFAINAANARWGSLYDALYGSDVIPGAIPVTYDAARGAQVVAWVRAFLDTAVPLRGGSHVDSHGYRIVDGRLVVDFADGTRGELADPDALVGYTGEASGPSRLLLRHHGLHLEVLIDGTGPVGAADPAGIADVVLESAITTIMDLEDAVAAVDADDKVLGYRTWLGLNRGDIQTEVSKGDSAFVRRLAEDRIYTAMSGDELRLPGRSLMFVRHVGHHMFTDAIRDGDGNEIPEGILDAFVTALCALPDLRAARPINSRARSLYVVKPKMHGPDEVALSVELFAAVEHALGLPARTIKIGIMDEERRTSVNLSACIRAAADRVVFINTGFLDRTGDEIHTAMHAGPFLPKQALRTHAFMRAYEDRNVDAGLAAGFAGRAQIGKGMWAVPARMRDMIDQKIVHPRAAASTAWVPSPTAATLHAIHYHEVDVADRQRELQHRAATPVAGILDIPLAPADAWAGVDVDHELDLNVQSILGYVVRWVDQGIGCSTVPDLDGVGLMEDRATLRISSQLLANWLLHGIIDGDRLDASLARVARVVDAQNAGDPAYVPFAEQGTAGPAYRAARALVTEGAAQPNGYTEPILHAARRAAKSVRQADSDRLTDPAR